MYKFSVGPIFGKYLKTRYAVISSFVGEEFINSFSKLDIFIDLNTIIPALGSSSKFLQSLPFANEDEVEVDIIENTLTTMKHWKDWASNKFQDVRVFLIVNEFEVGKLPEREIIKSYLAPYINKYDSERYAQMNYYWTESMNKVEIVLKYVPNSYLIRCNTLDNYIVPNVIDDYKTNGRARIIISGIPMITTYMLEPNTKVILSKFNHQLSDPTMIVQSVSNIDNDIMNTFIKNKVFYALLNAVIGDFGRGLIGITQMGISSFANDLLRAFERGDIPRDPKTIDSVLPIIDSKYHDYLRKAYQLIDIDTHSRMIPASTIEKLKASLVDLYDIDAFIKLKVGNLNLMELL
jgi:hypothetical protein